MEFDDFDAEKLLEMWVEHATKARTYRDGSAPAHRMKANALENALNALGYEVEAEWVQVRREYENVHLREKVSA